MPRQTDQPVIAIVGATGLVGREFLEILSGHGLGRGDVRAFASARSAGGTVAFGDTKLDVRQLSPDVFAGVGLAFFCAGGDVSRDLAPAAARQGAVVIDNSSAFRMQPDVPLVIPEINGDVLDCATPGIVANPNCSTIIALSGGRRPDGGQHLPGRVRGRGCARGRARAAGPRSRRRPAPHPKGAGPAVPVQPVLP
jgi:hypothetical protein